MSSSFLFSSSFKASSHCFSTKHDHFPATQWHSINQPSFARMLCALHGWLTDYKKLGIQWPILLVAKKHNDWIIKDGQCTKCLGTKHIGICVCMLANPLVALLIVTNFMIDSVIAKTVAKQHILDHNYPLMFRSLNRLLTNFAAITVAKIL